MAVDYQRAAEQAVTAILADLAATDPIWADMLGVHSTPRYRFWRIKRTSGKSPRDFEYTTETADGGKYWAIERRWIRTKNGERGKVIRMVGFKTRKKAKARAYEWYTKARTPAPVTA